MRFNEILQKLIRFPENFQNFTFNNGILLRFYLSLMYFINFRFCFQCFQKFTAKCWSLLNWFKILDLAMIKVEKVNFEDS